MRFAFRMLSLSTTLFGVHGIARNDVQPQSARDIRTTPLILEKSDGEYRVRRRRETPIPTRQFTIKVDRKNGGSQKMWLGTEEIPPGGCHRQAQASRPGRDSVDSNGQCPRLAGHTRA
jgi:hypothetical protein